MRCQIKHSIIALPFHFYLISNSNLECKDTPSWDDGWGMGCESYAANPGLCSYYGGSDHNNPHLNCCVCGKTGKCSYCTNVLLVRAVTNLQVK